MPPRGPRNVLCVVDVTKSAIPTGVVFGCANVGGIVEFSG